MPTYEYQCSKCGDRFEVFQRIVDPPVKDCPKCKSEGSVEQIISGGSGLIFKGSGFYETDYRRSSTSSKPATPEKPNTSDRKTGSGSSTGTDD
jgi:putative FmdB family regulatory protein